MDRLFSFENNSNRMTDSSTQTETITEVKAISTSNDMAHNDDSDKTTNAASTILDKQKLRQKKTIEEIPMDEIIVDVQMSKEIPTYMFF
jgi:hypothetical protein